MCSALSSGFASNVCNRFSGNTTGVCDNTGACIKTDTNRCNTNGVTPTAQFTCGSLACVEAGTCVNRNPVPSALSDVCFVNQDQAACADIQCQNFVKGWAGNVCQAYGSASRVGRCDGTATCFSGVAPSVLNTFCLTPSTLQTCPSSACVRSSACQPNTAPSTVATLSQACHQRRHGRLLRH